MDIEWEVAEMKFINRILLISALALAGCDSSGPALFPVSGTVTFNGNPLPTGYISFTPAESSAAPISTPIKDGSYSLELTEGVKKVAIKADRFVGPEDKVMGLRPREQYIPEEYNVNSILTAEVSVDGDNKFNFQLNDNSGGNSGP